MIMRRYCGEVKAMRAIVFNCVQLLTYAARVRTISLHCAMHCY
jgi:hypothetical protein